MPSFYSDPRQDRNKDALAVIWESSPTLLSHFNGLIAGNNFFSGYVLAAIQIVI
jgi:hypothetical protein